MWEVKNENDSVQDLRKRRCLINGEFNTTNENCIGSSTEVRSISSWTNWTSCDKLASAKHRQRMCNSNSTQRNCGHVNLNQQVPCPDLVEEDITPIWEPWVYGVCNASCGGGYMEKWRLDDNNTTEVVYESCNAHPCDLATYTEWMPWGECAASCGSTNQSRMRECVSSCQTAVTLDVRACVWLPPCPIDGGFTEWGVWRACSATCNGGVRSRGRNCTEPVPQFAGRDCLAVDEHYEDCNQIVCPINGEWSLWSNWSSCDVPCGGGNKTRRRQCDNPTPEFGGKPCQGHVTEFQACNYNSCNISKLEVTLEFTDIDYIPQYENLNSEPSQFLKQKITDSILALYKGKEHVIKDVIFHEIRNTDDVKKNRN